MGNEQISENALDKARLDVVEKYSNHLAAEVRLARQDGGFFDKKYWADFLATKTAWQDASNNFYILLHELAK